VVPAQSLVPADAAAPLPPPAGCADRCVRRNPMRAVGADVIAADCVRECARFADALPDCARSAAVIDRIATCDQMARDAREMMRGRLDTSYDAWIEIVAGGDPDAIARANQGCRDVATMQQQQAADLGCPP
jgi:hypothetical protein